MEAFGSFIHMGFKQPFETDIILEAGDQTKYKIGDKVKVDNDIGTIVQSTTPSEHSYTVYDVEIVSKRIVSTIEPLIELIEEGNNART